jgi:hypothetical protein
MFELAIAINMAKGATNIVLFNPSTTPLEKPSLRSNSRILPSSVAKFGEL